MGKLTFGPFRYDPAKKLLLRDGCPIALGSRATTLLDLLLLRRGEIVGTKDLLDAAWPGLAIEESNLSVQIAALRKALGPAPGGGAWIATVSRKGYRFVGPVAPLDQISELGRPGVAVLPFVDLSGTSGSRLTDYLTQDVITALSRFRSLRVSSRSSTARFTGGGVAAREVADCLGVQYVVEGSSRRFGDRLRFSVQLIDGTSGATVWADNLEPSMANGVCDTDELSGRAAAAIESHVHLAEISRSHRLRPESMEAYDCYLRGRRSIQTSTEADNAIALGLFFRAIELQPENVEYLAAAAEAIHHRTSVGWRSLPRATRKLAAEFAQRGMDRVEGDAASLGLFGNAMFTSYEEDVGAILTLRAAQMNNNSPLALLCDGLAKVWNGNFDDAEARFRRAAELSTGEPTERFAYQGLGKIAACREDWKSTLYWGQITHAVSPGLSGGHLQRIAASAMLGRMEDAHRYLSQFMSIAPGVTIRSIDAGQPFRNRSHITPVLKALRLAGMPER